MGNGFLNPGDNLKGYDCVQIFHSPVFFPCPDHSFLDLACPVISAYLHLLLPQPFVDCRYCHRRNLFMDHQRLAGIAHAHALRLCIVDDRYRHVNIRRCVHVDMAVASSCLNHGYRAVFHHVCDQPLASPWDEHIDILIHPHHLGGHVSVRILHQKHRILGQLLLLKPILNHFYDCLIRSDCIRTAS